MSFRSIPEDIRAKLFLLFCCKERIDDPAARCVLKELIKGLESTDPRNKIPEDVVRSFLNDPAKVEASIKKAKKELIRLAQENRRKNEKNVSSYLKSISSEMAKHGLPIRNLQKKIEQSDPLVRFIAIKMLKSGSMKSMLTYAWGWLL